MTHQEFIEEVAKYVAKYAPQFDIKVYSPIIAQFCLESAYGTSDKVVTTTVFGIKSWRHNYAGLKWRDKRCAVSNEYFEERTREQLSNGTYKEIVSKFCKFKSLEDCVLGYFQWTNISNYKNLKGITDPKKYLELIKQDGYATSLNYVDKLMQVITSNNLTKYDPNNKTTKEVTKMKVAIDAGHGSETSGKRHPDGYREHYSNTYIAYYLDQILRANGIDTFKSGWNDANAKDDADTPLTTRQANIKAAKCDISLSIHANAYGTSWNNANGVETYYHSTASYAGDSKKLADTVQKYLIKGTKQTDRKVKTAAYAMVNCKSMGTKASILTEVAFMTNKIESDLLKSDAFARETAQELAQAVFEYAGIKGNAFIELTGVDGKKPTTSTPATPATSTSTSKLNTGDTVKLSNTTLYASSSAKTGNKKTGTYYVWSCTPTNGRIKVTNAKKNVGVTGQVSGWVALSDLGVATVTSATATTTSATSTTTKALTAGLAVKLSNTTLYASSSAKTGNKKTGTYYVWGTAATNGRIKVTNAKKNVGVTGQVSGWVNKSDIGF